LGLSLSDRRTSERSAFFAFIRFAEFDFSWRPPFLSRGERATGFRIFLAMLSVVGFGGSLEGFRGVVPKAIQVVPRLGYDIAVDVHNKTEANTALSPCVGVPSPSIMEAISATATLGSLESKLRRLAGKAIADYNMIQEGDRVMVCVSGGKDSYTLLDLLLNLQRRAPVTFELVAVNLDQKHPNFPEKVLPAYLEELGVAYSVVEEDTYSVVKRVVPEGKTMCGLCSRLRRGVLYRVADDFGATKIALGHHRDDLIETLFLNMFFGGRLKAMAPKLLSDDKRHVVIRPLAYCPEVEISRYAELRDFPIIPCDLCGSQENSQRKKIKAMLAGWEREDPGRSGRLFRSLQNVSPSHLADPELYDFATLGRAADDAGGSSI
jgi:tRNA 2-thiocytidine biosynthesis protein TtcA